MRAEVWQDGLAVVGVVPALHASKSLLDQSAWWIVPVAVMAILLVLAMMECTRTLLVKQAPGGSQPVDGAELRRRLLALNDQQTRYRIVEGKPWDLELVWDVVPASWKMHLGRIKITAVYRARMLLDESRHELRWFEFVRGSDFFIGFYGWVPVFRWSWWAQSGYVDLVWAGLLYEVAPGFPPRIARVHRFKVNTVVAKEDIRRIVSESGWSFQPRLWWFQVRRSPAGEVSGALVARVFPRWSERRFWGVLYPALYVSLFAYIIAISGGWSSVTRQEAFVMLGISALWWGIWGVIARVLLVGSGPRRQHARGS